LAEASLFAQNVAWAPPLGGRESCDKL